MRSLWLISLYSWFNGKTKFRCVVCSVFFYRKYNSYSTYLIYAYRYDNWLVNTYKNHTDMTIDWLYTYKNFYTNQEFHVSYHVSIYNLRIYHIRLLKINGLSNPRRMREIYLWKSELSCLMIILWYRLNIIYLFGKLI